MKFRVFAGMCLGLGLFAYVSASAFSGDDKPVPAGGMPQMTPDMLAHMQECMKNMSPSEHHKLLERSVGTWKTTTKMWMMGEAGGPPMVTGGTAEMKMVLGGRYLMQEFKGVMKMPNEKGEFSEIPHEGIGLTGYDNDRNLYVGTWASSPGTALLNMRGSASRDGKSITFYGEMDEPFMKVFGRYVKYVLKFVSNDQIVFSIYDLHAGDDYKVVEVVYDRK
ncbi:MAG: DUF1579 domain-containing protein [Phycisphaerae bacterium]|nr:DUF1579 domain-containing protein [Phycisphaerae bacterium]